MSNSKTWKNRKNELKQKELLILEDLNLNSSRAKKIAIWSLGVGVVTLIGYGIYRSLSSPPSEEFEKTNKKKWVPKDSPIVDSAIENLAPSIGKWLLKQLKD